MKLFSKRVRHLCLLVIPIFIVFIISGCSNHQDNGNWTKFSDMELIPNIEFNSPWTIQGSFDYYYTYRGILSFKTSEAFTGFYIHPDERFNNNIGTTAEVRVMFLENSGSDYNLFSIQDGKFEGKIAFLNDQIKIFDQNELKATYKVNTGDNFHIYRLSIVKKKFEVYVDGEKIATVEVTHPVLKKAVFFGDFSETQSENINAQIDYIAYSVDGAFAPGSEIIKHENKLTAPVVRIMPETPQKSDNLICNIIVESTGADKAAIEYSYAWFRDGILQPALISETVESSKIDFGEIWKCVVTPNDGFVDGPSGEAETTISLGIWSKFSGMQILPEQEPEIPWQVLGNFEVKNISNGILTLATGGKGTGLFTHIGDGFDNKVGTTVEIKMKLLDCPENDHDACLLSIQDGTREGKISFFKDRIEIRDQNDFKKSQFIDTENGFHVYRLVMVGDNLAVYIDGEIVASITLSMPNSNKALIFGDGSVGEGENFHAEIDYIAYSIGSQIEP